MATKATSKKKFKKGLSSLLAGPVVKKVMANIADKKVREISEHFPHIFKPKVAETEEERNSTFSIHCFLQYRPTGKLAGKVRVVRPENENQQLPMQHYLENGFNEEDISPDDLRQDKIAQIYRLSA